MRMLRFDWQSYSVLSTVVLGVGAMFEMREDLMLKCCFWHRRRERDGGVALSTFCNFKHSFR